MRTNNDQNSSLEYLILKALEEHYSCAEEILKKLKKEEVEFEERKFFPVLSGLLLNKMLCYNWLENESGIPEKHYHLTRTGFSYINK